jgi:hypothetical protein
MCLLLLTALVAGCSRDQRSPPSAQAQLGQIGVAYNSIFVKNGRAPQSVEELKAALKRFGDPETIIVSPNDGQPFTICWGVPCTQLGSKGVPLILAYEAVGVEGKKYVLNNMLAVQQMTEADLGQALQTNK